MTGFTTVNKVDENGFICKCDVFETRDAADARIVELHQMPGYEDAFVVDNAATAVNGEMCFQITHHWPVDVANKTISFDQVAFDRDKHNDDMELLRIERNNRLQASDIMVLPDRWDAMAADTKTAWTSHRQALRDLPAKTADPANPTWPEEPVQ